MRSPSDAAGLENRNVIPTLHKLYSLAAILHLSPLEISGWYEAPFDQIICDGASFPPPRTHLGEPLSTSVALGSFNRHPELQTTEILVNMVMLGFRTAA